MTQKTILQQSDSGFTLIEMAIVMIIGGILVAFMGSALLLYAEKSRVNKTEIRIEAVKEALTQYLNVNRRYPCVARRDIAPGEAPAVPSDKSFGREVSENCALAPLMGTARSAVIGKDLDGDGTNDEFDRVRIGSVPVRSLNLPDDMAFDGWGRRFTYAVTEKLANSGAGSTQYTNDGGFISVSDSTGIPFITNAHYVLFSHGRTGDGGFSFEGNTVTPCSASALDRENCDGDAEFMTTLANSEADSSDFFDDYVYYQGQTVPQLLFPTGAVMAFNLAQCPDGWANFAEAEGKFIVGADNGVAPPPPSEYKNYRVRVGSGSSNGNYPIEPYGGAAGVDVTPFNIAPGDSTLQPEGSLIPPYHALLYCEKLPN